MASHKAYVKLLKKTNTLSVEITRAIFNFESFLSKNIENSVKKEILFPSVCIWTVKN
jgi:hypothetical protein